MVEEGGEMPGRRHFEAREMSKLHVVVFLPNVAVVTVSEAMS